MDVIHRRYVMDQGLTRLDRDLTASGIGAASCSVVVKSTGHELDVLAKLCREQHGVETKRSAIL